MLTRLQLANGYVAGTLTDEEKKVAEQFPLVMKQVDLLRQPKVKAKPIKNEGVKKHARFKTS